MRSAASQRRVLPVVLLLNVISAALRLITCFSSFDHHFYPIASILHGAPDWSLTIYLDSVMIISITLAKLVADCSSPFQPCPDLLSCPWSLWAALHDGEKFLMERLKGFTYVHNPSVTDTWPHNQSNLL